MRWCKKCNTQKSEEEFYRYAKSAGGGLRPTCKLCHNSNTIDYQRRNPNKRRQYGLKAKYGLTEEEYNRLLEEQLGRCAICIERCQMNENLAVDHNHSTGRVRGLLCSTCNTAIGMLKDDIGLLENAIRYLARYNAVN